MAGVTKDSANQDSLLANMDEQKIPLNYTVRKRKTPEDTMEVCEDSLDQPSHASSGYGSLVYDSDMGNSDYTCSQALTADDTSSQILGEELSLMDDDDADTDNSARTHCILGELSSNIQHTAIASPMVRRIKSVYSVPAQKESSSNCAFGTSRAEKVKVDLPMMYPEPQGIRDLLSNKRCKQEIHGENHWNKLSDEMILCIFGWLPKIVLNKCARVCKRWHQLSFDETLWRRLDLANRNLTPGVLGRVLDRGVQVLRLTKSEIHTPIHCHQSLSPSAHSMSHTSKEHMHIHLSLNANHSSVRLCQLEYLDLTMSSITAEGIELLLSSCRMLRKLSLENCVLTPKACRFLGANRNIDELNLCMCQGLAEASLIPIFNGLTRLESLNIGWTNLSRGDVVYLIVCLPASLKKLNLSGCRENLQDEDVRTLCEMCPNLLELDLSDATLITERSIELIAMNLTKLRYIALSRCYHVPPESLHSLTVASSHLVAIDIFGMLKESSIEALQEEFGNDFEINKHPFSSIARPTTGQRRTSIWGLRVRDRNV